MPESHKDLEAIRAVVDIIEPFDSTERERIIRWSGEKLGVTSGIDITSGNIWGLLYFLFRESIQEENKDKRYFIGRLKEMNKVAEALADYLESLSEVSRELEKLKRESDSEEDKITVELRRIGIETKFVKDASEINNLVAFCECVLIQTVTAELSADQLQREIANVEAQRESVRNKRQMISTQFENANKKADQYINMVSQVLKTMNEMATGIIRNIR